MAQPDKVDEARLAVGTKCSRIKRNGERCGQYACVGTTLCAAHGGTSPAIKQAAFNALQALAPLAIDRARELLTPPTKENSAPCPLCKRDMPLDPVITSKLLIAILDRTGFGPKSTLEINNTVDDGWVEYCTEDEAEDLMRIMMKCRERMGQDAPPIDDGMPPDSPSVN